MPWSNSQSATCFNASVGTALFERRVAYYCAKVWDAFYMRLIIAALIALVASAEANAEDYILAIQPGGPYSATPGGEIARIQKQRGLPNAFGFDDIFGCKVDTGLIQFIYFGQAPDGKAMIRRIDIDVLSTATTMSRTPGFIWGQGQAWGTLRYRDDHGQPRQRPAARQHPWSNTETLKSLFQGPRRARRSPPLPQEERHGC
jgi:hypothetical protein